MKGISSHETACPRGRHPTFRSAEIIEKWRLTRILASFVISWIWKLLHLHIYSIKREQLKEHLLQSGTSIAVSRHSWKNAIWIEVHCNITVYF